MITTQCSTCINYIDDLKCAAFPDGIPEKILTAEISHEEPIKGQENDIAYEPIK